MANYPRHVTIGEVGLRDGLQIEKTFVPTATKIDLINRIARAGVKKIEVSSFVHPKIVPQMADAEEVFAGIERRAGVDYGALIPNVKGLQRAFACGIDEVKIGVAASDTFNKLNFRMSVDENIAVLDQMYEMQKGRPGTLVGGVATAFGCPYEGDIAADRLLRLVRRLAGYGVLLIFLADTTGVANPEKIRRTVGTIRNAWPAVRLGLHLHNTRGLGLANALAGLECGVDYFEGSIGGLGGCPFAPKAVGNICTEDFVHMLHEMGIETGIDLDALIDVAREMQDVLGRPLPGMVMKAGKASDIHDPAGIKIKID